MTLNEDEEWWGPFTSNGRGYVLIGQARRIKPNEAHWSFAWNWDGPEPLESPYDHLPHLNHGDNAASLDHIGKGPTGHTGIRVPLVGSRWEEAVE